MKNIIYCIFLAGFCGALVVPCGSTHDFGSTTTANYLTCTVNQQNGGGGAAIITHNGYYCLKAMYAYWWGTWWTHFDLLKGANCGAWQPGDYCYAPISPYDCSHGVPSSGGWNFGDPNGMNIQYSHTGNFIAVAEANAAFNPTMVFHNATFIAYYPARANLQTTERSRAVNRQGAANPTTDAARARVAPNQSYPRRAPATETSRAVNRQGATVSTTARSRT